MRSNKPESRRNTPGLQSWSDLVCLRTVSKHFCGIACVGQGNSMAALMMDIGNTLICCPNPCPQCSQAQALLYAGQLMDDSKCLQDYSVPKVADPRRTHDAVLIALQCDTDSTPPGASEARALQPDRSKAVLTDAGRHHLAQIANQSRANVPC